MLLLGEDIHLGDIFCGLGKIYKILPKLSSIGNLPPKVVEEILRNRPSFDTVMYFGCQFLLRRPKETVIIVKCFVNGNMKKSYAEGRVRFPHDGR